MPHGHAWRRNSHHSGLPWLLPSQRRLRYNLAWFVAVTQTEITGATMPFYLRKSISAGPFRFNLSKSGVGLSVGVKGLRIGTGPRGHYIHAGRGGLYYRASLGRAGQRTPRSSSSSPRTDPPPAPPSTYREHGVEMIEVHSGDVLEMRDARFEELLNELNAKQKQIRFATMFALGVGAIALGIGTSGLGASILQGQLAFWVTALALPAWGIGRWLDSYKRKAVLFYNLEKDAAEAYEAVTSAFDRMIACAGKWHIEAGGAVRDLTTWKRNAGASHLVDRKPTKLEYHLPNAIATNITPPSVQIGRRAMYFFPDAVFIFDGKRVGAVGYDDLELRFQSSNFIEDGKVPSDAKVIGRTWKHPRKDGGPDRRFSNNYQIPICLYEVAHFTSANGLNELLEFSRTGVAEPFAAALRAVLQRTGRQATALPHLKS